MDVLDGISSITVPRCFVPAEMHLPCELQLHHSDASETGYASVRFCWTDLLLSSDGVIPRYSTNYCFNFTIRVDCSSVVSQTGQYDQTGVRPPYTQVCILDRLNFGSAVHCKREPPVPDLRGDYT